MHTMFPLPQLISSKAHISALKKGLGDTELIYLLLFPRMDTLIKSLSSDFCFINLFHWYIGLCVQEVCRGTGDETFVLIQNVGFVYLFFK